MGRVARRGASAFGLALALVLAAPGAQASDWPQPPLPDGTDVSEITPRMVYNGLDMHPQLFRSKTSPQRMVEYYRARWGKRVVVDKVGEATVIGHREGDYYYTIRALADGAGSHGSVSVLRLPHHPVKPDLGKGFARPSDTRVFNDIGYPDDPTPARTLGMVNTLSPHQNAEFYKRHLMSDGWKPAGRNDCAPSAGSCVLSYERGDSKLLLSLAGGDGRSKIIANLINP